MRLRIATCQFPTSRDIGRNLEYVLRQMRIVHARVADVAHFPEACLSGYAGADIASTEEVDWDLLRHSTRRARDLAGDLGMWVVLGSTDRLTPPHKPARPLAGLVHLSIKKIGSDSGERACVVVLWVGRHSALIGEVGVLRDRLWVRHTEVVRSAPQRRPAGRAGRRGQRGRRRLVGRSRP